MIFIVSTVAVVLVVIFTLALLHAGSPPRIAVTVARGSLHNFRPGDLVTNGREVFLVRTVRAPNTLIVTRED